MREQYDFLEALTIGKGREVGQRLQLYPGSGAFCPEPSASLMMRR